MTEVVNLRRARKERSRAEEKRIADANAALHGRTKAQRLLEATEAEQARRRLDQHRFDEE